MQPHPPQQLISTPLGDARCRFAETGALCELHLLKSGDGQAAVGEAAGGPAAAVAAQLTEYFAGTRREFDLPLAPAGTEFQRAVWAELLKVPYGSTTTYGELARCLGKADAVRAVGAANGANPVWIIIPCHRVLGADGSLTGYAGGIEVKQRLLELEGALPRRLFE